MNFSLNMMSLMGLSLSVGLLIDDAIVVIENISRHLNMGKSPIQAGHTRLMPILMTTLAMIFGMIPTAIGSGSSASTRFPMAYAIIGGLITSTLLTLFVVPCIYTILDDWKSSWGRKALIKSSEINLLVKKNIHT